MQSRETRLNKLKENPNLSVLIIGAGINGIGTFRDLAFQGVDVVLVDHNDYCSGASAASSHMVHGGIRYLENGEFRLVKEAVVERNRLIENAPHLVKPLPTTIPIFKIFSGLFNAPLKFLGLLDRPSERGAVVIKLGMVFYDFFTRNQKTVGKHVFKNRKESLGLFPLLNPAVKHTGTYYDGAMHSPERIALELIQDAANENDRAIPLNYVSLSSVEKNIVTLHDEMSGEKFNVKPKVVVNAAGPWIDMVNQSIGVKTHFISGTKGSHLILDHPELRKAIGDYEIFFENKDGRIVLIYPIKDKVLIGTSDIRVDNPNDIAVTDTEVDYFFEMVSIVFPKISIDRSHIGYTFSGVRPLQHTAEGTTGQISRDHTIKNIEKGGFLDFPVLSLVGGKWTSFRAFSEEATDEVLEILGKDRLVSTKEMRIGGGQDYPDTQIKIEEKITSWQKNSNSSLHRVNILFNRFGSRAEDILKTFKLEDGGPLKEYPKFSKEEIKFLIENEDIHHLDDLIFRRTMIGKLGLITKPGLNELAMTTGELLGWDAEKTEDEIRRVKDILIIKHRMDFNTYISDK